MKDNNKSELLSIYGENYNTIDKLLNFFKHKYHPTIFNSMAEFVKTPYFNAKNLTVEDYTDGYILNTENYIILLFDNPLDFASSTHASNLCEDIVISYDERTRKISKYFSTGYTDEKLEYIECFID